MQKPPSQPRGVVLTAVRENEAILCKAGPRVRNTYEVRLCLYFAVLHHKEFLLAVAPDAAVDAGLESHLAAHGGRIVRGTLADHTVYIGAEDPGGAEIEGWVAGSREDWKGVLDRTSSLWLKENLKVGRDFGGRDLDRLRIECRDSSLDGANIDREPLASAVLHLIDVAMASSGRVFIQ